MLSAIPFTSHPIPRWAAFGWLVVAAGSVIQVITTVDWQRVYIVMTVLGTLVGLMTLVALAKMLSGAEVPTQHRAIALGAGLLALAAIAFVNWAHVVWSALFALATAWSLWRLGQTRAGAAHEPAPSAGLKLLLASWPLGLAAFLALEAIGFGPVDDYGDHPWAGAVGITVWCLVFATGLLRSVSWLAGREQPA